ncbi:MAG TPA: cysteine dioxygenase family protein [Planctomycetota bacterium]
MVQATRDPSRPQAGFTFDDPCPRLVAYVSEVRGILAGRKPLAARMDDVIARAAHLAGQGTHIPGDCRLVGGTDAYGRNLVYRDVDYGFVMIAMVWPAGAESPAHDHGTWCCVKVLEGAVRIAEFERGPDGAVLGAAQVCTAAAGDTCLVRPPRDIHRVWNPFDAGAVTLHTYGREIKSCRVFDEAGGSRQHAEMGYANRSA